MFINIYSKGSYPSSELSNFAPHEFVIDGIKCSCMEAFLQSLKFSDIFYQKDVVCKLQAKEAKQLGSLQEWQSEGILYWNEKIYSRYSREYRKLLLRAYRQLAFNQDFLQALRASKGKLLIHTIGRWRRKNTVLTWWEFCYILMKIRCEIDK